jgi:hypothetical protein
MPLAFMSHTRRDKGLVEPFALAAAAEIGQHAVFYDSWSIQPGDGIVASMDDALGNCTHFFLFMSEASLTSEMVKLEWQNAVMRRAGGEIRLIPVRLDACQPPPLLLQLKYIDAYTDGQDVAIEAMRRALRGEQVFRPTDSAENVAASVKTEEDGSVSVRISVAAYQEPNPSFAIFVDGSAEQIDVTAPSESMYATNFGGGHHRDGRRAECVFLDKQSPLVPSRPLVVKLRDRTGRAVTVGERAIERAPGQGKFLPITRE